ncbi:hypothetical protein Plhal304r1_c027g0090801 [Plasmopara halstedii]
MLLSCFIENNLFFLRRNLPPCTSSLSSIVSFYYIHTCILRLKVQYVFLLLLSVELSSL